MWGLPRTGVLPGKPVPGKPSTYRSAAPTSRRCGACLAWGSAGNACAGKARHLQVRRTCLSWMRSLPRMGVSPGNPVPGEPSTYRAPALAPRRGGACSASGLAGKACAGRARHLQGHRTCLPVDAGLAPHGAYRGKRHPSLPGGFRPPCPRPRRWPVRSAWHPPGRGTAWRPCHRARSGRSSAGRAAWRSRPAGCRGRG